MPSTQELLRPPVTTTITNMTNAFIVSVLQTGISKIFAELRVKNAFQVKISLFRARTGHVGFEIASHKNIHTQMCYIIEGFTQNYYLETKISSL